MHAANMTVLCCFAKRQLTPDSRVLCVAGWALSRWSEVRGHFKSGASLRGGEDSFPRSMTALESKQSNECLQLSLRFAAPVGVRLRHNQQ